MYWVIGVKLFIINIFYFFIELFFSKIVFTTYNILFRNSQQNSKLKQKTSFEYRNLSHRGHVMSPISNG